MDDKLVTVAEYDDSVLADMAKLLLEENGIEAVITGENVGNVLSGIPVAIDLELQVFERDAKRAAEILEAAEEKQAESAQTEIEDEQEGQ